MAESKEQEGFNPMTTEKHNTVLNEEGNQDSNGNENSRHTREMRSGRAQGKTHHHILLGLVLFVALSLVILKVNEDPQTLVIEAPDSDVSEAIALSESANVPQEFSPQVLEDFRSDPSADLEVVSLPIEPLPLPEESAEGSGDDNATLEEIVQAPEGDDFSLGEALARYLLTMQDELNREYVESCIQFRSRNGQSAGCPENPALSAATYQEETALVEELFTIITRQSDYARISRRLERENETLTALLDDPANPAVSQASYKLALNNDYIEYLNGNPSPAVTAFNQMNDFINDYNRTILSGPVQFNCQGVAPCVYEFNEPDAE